jgi:hypothetical protein
LELLEVTNFLISVSLLKAIIFSASDCMYYGEQIYYVWPPIPRIYEVKGKGKGNP